MDKENVVHIYNEILVIKKNELMALAATWIDLEMIILSEVRQRQISYDHLQGYLKYDTDEILTKQKQT